MATRRSPSGRAAGAVAKAAGVLVVFACALVLGVLAHLGAPAFRRAAVGAANRALAGALRGSVEVGLVGHLSWLGLENGSVAVRDPEGRTVFQAQNLRLRLDTPRLLWAWLARRRALPLEFEELRARVVDVRLVPGPDGRPSLLRALEPTPGGAGSGSSRTLRFEFGHLQIDRLVVRGMIRQPVVARVLARGAFSGGGDRDAILGADGSFGEVPFRLRAAVAGAALDVRVDVDRATSAALRELLPSPASGGAWRLRAEARGGLPALWVTADLEETRGGRLDVAATAVAGTAPILEAEVAARGLDASRLAPGAPPTAVNATAYVAAQASPGTGIGAVLAAVEVPSAHVKGWTLPSFGIFAACDEEEADVVLLAHGSARAGGAPKRSDAVEGADAQVSAHVDFRRRTSRGHVVVHVTSARLGSVRVRTGFVRGAWRGPLQNPAGQVSGRAKEVAVGGERFGRIAADASLSVSGGRLAIGRSSFGLTRKGITLAANAGRIEVGAGRLGLSDVVLTGLGAPARGDFASSQEGVSVRLRAPRVELAKLERLLGETRQEEGVVSIDLEVHGTAESATGRARVHLDAPAVPRAGHVRGTASVALSGRAVTGRLEAAWEGASLRASLAHGAVAGPLSSVRSWSWLVGTIDVDSTIPLASVTPGLPPSAQTGLRGVDAAVRVRVDLRTGRIEVRGDLHDRAGPIAMLHASSRFDLTRSFRARREWTRALEHAPIDVSAEIPQRSIATLPSAFIPGPVKGLRGTVEASLSATGTPSSPHVEVRVVGRDLAQAHALAGGPFDGTFDGSYDGRAATGQLTLSRAQRSVLDARGEVAAPLAAWLGPTPRPAWDARLQLGLHGFPIESIPALARRKIGGVASGEISVEGLHRDARAQGTVRVDKLVVGKVCFDSGEARLRYEGARLSVMASLERGRSAARATVDAGATWGAAATPSFDPRRPIAATLAAREFPARALLPLLWGPVTELEGRIDGNVKVTVGSNLASGQWAGDVRLSRGVLEFPALGERFDDVSARLFVGPWGTVHLEDVSARNGEGKMTASARAVFAGSQLRSATIDLDVPRDKRLPLTVAGVPVGQVSGHAHAEGSVAPGGVTLETKVVASGIQVELPASNGHSLQSLQPAPGVSVGARVAGGRFVAEPMQPRHRPPSTGGPEVHATLDLGQIHIRRSSSLDITLTGHPVVDMRGDNVTLRGVVDVKRGSIQAFGKRFTLEPSTIGFTGDPDHPQLHVTAKYDAPDKTNIYADVTGTPDNMHLTLRSDPPHSQDEIFGLLLFGTENGPGGGPPIGPQSDVAQAGGLAGGVLTEGVNQALSGVTSLQIATRLDTSQATNPRPMVEVRLSSDVMTRVTVQTGMPAPGEPRDLTLVTLGWRFHPRWSLETTVGDAGSTAVEVLWRHRY